MIHGRPTATAPTARRWPELRQIGVSVTAGFITAVLQIGILFSIAALIFSGPLAGYLGDVVRLVLVGCALMMILFALLSSRPAMLAYSQDAPAISIAVMAAQLAGSLALDWRRRGSPPSC